MRNPAPAPAHAKPNARDDDNRARQLARRVASWPAIDQGLWNASCCPGDPLDDPGHGASLRLASQHKIAKGYTYWLAFLRETGLLDEAVPPEARISHARSAAWFRALKARGNRPFTIVGRFSELNLALKVLAPSADRSCVLRPNGASVRRRLFLEKRVIYVPDARILYMEGIRLMDTADQCGTARKRLLQYRDGLLFAILAARGRRLGTTAQTMNATNLRYAEGRYWIEYRRDQIKTNKTDNVLLPARLTTYITRYLEDVRPPLLRGPDHGALWVGNLGGPLAEDGINKVIRTRSKALLGVSIGPHRFRHAIGTTAPLVNRTEPGLARAVIDISEAVMAENYNRATTTFATTVFHQYMLEATQEAENRARLGNIKVRL